MAEIAFQEDVAVVGLSCLSGAHKVLFPAVVQKLREKNADDTLVIGGGVIPPGDIPVLLAGGVSAVFGPGTSIKEVARYIRENVKT